MLISVLDSRKDIQRESDGCNSRIELIISMAAEVDKTGLIDHSSILRYFLYGVWLSAFLKQTTGSDAQRGDPNV